MLPIDHLGFVTHDADGATAFLGVLAGYDAISAPVHDAEQDVMIQFLSRSREPGMRIELLSPASPASPVLAATKRGGGVHHICFQVADLNDFSSWCREAGLRMVKGPTPAPAFGDGRRVAFCQGPGLGLMEFVETSSAPDLPKGEACVVKGMTRRFMEVMRDGSCG